MGLGNSDQPQKRCVLILRDIVDAKNYVNDPKAGRFMDLNLNNNDNPPTKQVRHSMCLCVYVWGGGRAYGGRGVGAIGASELGWKGILFRGRGVYPS